MPIRLTFDTQNKHNGTPGRTRSPQDIPALYRFDTPEDILKNL